MRIVLVPGVPALLPEYRSLLDPVAPLRAACLDAVRWLGPAPRVLADAAGTRVAEALLAEVVGTELDGGLDTPAGLAPDRGRARTADTDGLLVVGNGSARRTESSPGPYDARAVAFDDALGRALRGPDPTALRGLDTALAEELWASVATFGRLAEELDGARLAGVDYDDAPHGVQYWVLRWER